MRVGLVAQRTALAIEVAAVAARAGAQVVPLEAAESSFVDVVLVDVRAVVAGGPGGAGGRRAPVVVVCSPGESALGEAAAVIVGAGHVVELPAGADWLVEQLSAQSGARTLWVLGALGGLGASSVAIGCALAAAPDCLLVDADPFAPGLDLPLGIPQGSGARWSAIPASDAPLDPGSIRSALPSVSGVSVLTGPLPEPGWAGRLNSVLGVGRTAFAHQVVDSGRAVPLGAKVEPGDAYVLVVTGTLAGILAGRRALAALPGRDQLVLAVAPCSWLPVHEVADQLEGRSWVELPRLPRAAELADCGELDSGRTGRSLRRLGQRIWEVCA
ncbi:MAG: hypothetical protein WCF04_12855 [Candidatus Nanopelagicales bacterium]